MDSPVKNTWNWGITLVLCFICSKIVIDLEIDIWPWIKENTQTFQANTHWILIQQKTIYKKLQNNIVYVTQQS